MGVIPLVPDYRLSVGQLYDHLFSRFLTNEIGSQSQTMFKSQNEKTAGVNVRLDLTEIGLDDVPEFIELVDSTLEYYEARLPEVVGDQ